VESSRWIFTKRVPKVHVFVDFSNILAGARNKGRQDEDFSVHLKIKGLVPVVTNGRIIDESLCVGSLPDEGHFVWDQWRKAGFKTDVASLVNGMEDRVDETLHAAMMGTILHYKDSAHDRTIILLSGDGNDNHGRKTTFPKCLEYALDAGYKVEVWSWKRCTSCVYKKNFKGRDQYSLLYLDTHRSLVASTGTARSCIRAAGS
jgi:hypothetical protein